MFPRVRKCWFVGNDSGDFTVILSLNWMNVLNKAFS